MITSLRHQRTLARTSYVEGFGYWSGRDVRVEFHPAPKDTGIVFVRRDLGRPIHIAAGVANRVEVPRRTNLAFEGVGVDMVEHVMAALAGMRIDNCKVWVNSKELPGCDGSSLPFVAALEAAGVVEQFAPRRALQIKEVVRVGDDQCWVEARPSATADLTVTSEIDYSRVAAIGRQKFTITVTPGAFRHELAPARTFILTEEAEWLRQRGLGTRVRSCDLLVFGDDGLIDNELRYADECVRHKTLDLIGDLALAGCDLIGCVTAYCSGHRLNAELVSRLLHSAQQGAGVRKSA